MALDAPRGEGLGDQAAYPGVHGRVDEQAGSSPTAGASTAERRRRTPPATVTAWPRRTAGRAAHGRCRRTGRGRCRSPHGRRRAPSDAGPGTRGSGSSRNAGSRGSQSAGSSSLVGSSIGSGSHTGHRGSCEQAVPGASRRPPARGRETHARWYVLPGSGRCRRRLMPQPRVTWERFQARSWPEGRTAAAVADSRALRAGDADAAFRMRRTGPVRWRSSRPSHWLPSTTDCARLARRCHPTGPPSAGDRRGGGTGRRGRRPVERACATWCSIPTPAGTRRTSPCERPH